MMHVCDILLMCLLPINKKALLNVIQPCASLTLTLNELLGNGARQQEGRKVSNSVILLLTVKTISYLQRLLYVFKGQQ